MNVSSVEVPDQCVIIVHMGSAEAAAIPGWLYSAVFYRSSDSGVPSKPLRCRPVTEFERLAYPALD